MKKFLTLALLGSMALATPALAQSTSYDSDVKADSNAIAKDNNALAKDQATLQENRAKKAQDEASGNLGAQAVDSTIIGANHLGIGEKEGEKATDQKIHHFHKRKQQDVKQEEQKTGVSE